MNGLLKVEPEHTRPLMERVLRSGGEIAAEYPLVFRDDFPGDVVAVGEGEEIRSAAAILQRDFLTPQGTVSVGLIGSVSTDPAWQGKGLATRVLIEAEAELERRGCHIALLWADDPKFYYARGYRPIGAEVDFVIPRELAKRLPKAEGVRPLEDADTEALHTLYARHPSRVDRSVDETDAMLACPGMSTLALERDGELVAYACLGRGFDLHDAIHEWGGAVDDVLALVRAHLEQRYADGEPGRVFLMAPVGAAELLQRLDEAGTEGQVGVLGLAKVLSREACADLLDRALKPDGGAALETTEDDTRFAFRGTKSEGFLDDETLLAILFPAYGLDAEIQDFKEGFGLEGASFPLEPFAWGLDSI